jgi:5-methyltetrahydropteroyltriglutamate--homocysteine methyltransferase
MKTQNLGYPRIGSQRELKKACEQYWSGKSTLQDLFQAGRKIRLENLHTQKNAGIDLIPCNDFSYYDQVLDLSLTLGVIPERFQVLLQQSNFTDMDLYFAMARGYQKNGFDIQAMEMTKWFDTNYHYIVPEFTKNQKFSLFNEKVIHEFYEAKETLGFTPKPVLIGPVSYLLLGKEKESGFHKLDLLDNLLVTYEQILSKLEEYGATWIQFDEPFLVMDLSTDEKIAFKKTYDHLKSKFKYLNIQVATYFEGVSNHLALINSLPVDMLHVDLVRGHKQLDDLLSSNFVDSKKILSLGVIDGRNIWKNDYSQSLEKIQKAISKLGARRVIIAPSNSLLHVPYDLDLETHTQSLPLEIKNWMAFAKQKLSELVELSALAFEGSNEETKAILERNQRAIQSRRDSPFVHKKEVQEALMSIKVHKFDRKSSFAERQDQQHKVLSLPLLPTTTIGSFPQTEEVRAIRAKFKKGEISDHEYDQFISKELTESIKWQEEIGIDVLVHGEFERNDMVEYFGEQLDGYVFSANGWVQSYGSRCVKPPIIYGDISRKGPMTVKWTAFAQNISKKFVKGMLTGPVTMLQWSFVRDDQARKDTCYQLGLAILAEVLDLEKAGIKVIQIDEPAIREGLPLRKGDWAYYLDWAVNAFKISCYAVQDTTQIHTHMCYSEFNDIIQNIAAMDADVITIETSRSQMELLDAFVDFQYPNEIGPGVYDIHSPRIPTVEEMVNLLKKALAVIPEKNLWVNPDCGLKTRKWPETKVALENMVAASRLLREQLVTAE